MYLWLSFILLTLLASAAETAEWWEIASLRQLLSSEVKPVGYWAGPIAKKPEAAFLAGSEAAGNIHSVVRIGADVSVRFDGKVRVEGAQSLPVSSLDLEGAQVGEWLVLFHTEPGLARSVLSFETRGGGDRVRVILGGLAPGMWEIWRNGWVVDTGVPVRAREGVLYFEERPGSYFLRRLS